MWDLTKVGNPCTEVTTTEIEDAAGKGYRILIPTTVAPIIETEDGVRVVFMDQETMFELEETIEQLHAQLNHGRLRPLHEGQRIVTQHAEEPLEVRRNREQMDAIRAKTTAEKVAQVAQKGLQQPSPAELDAFGDQVVKEGLQNGSLLKCFKCNKAYLVAAGPHRCEA